MSSSSNKVASHIAKSLPSSLPGLSTTTCTKARCANTVRSLSSARSRQRPQVILTCFRKTPQTRLYYDYAIHRPQQMNNPFIPASYHKQLPLFDFFASTKPKPSYLFSAGATGFAKRRGTQQPQKQQYDPFEQSYQSTQVGEDAYFIRSDALGVADGVGGWTGTLGKY